MFKLEGIRNVQDVYASNAATNLSGMSVSAGNNFSTSIFSQSDSDKLKNKTEQDPEEFLKLYADVNGISIEKARQELVEKYGEPDKNQATQANAAGTVGNFFATNSIKDDSAAPKPGQDPDDFAKEYAGLKNLSIDNAKTELLLKFGEPQR